MTRNHTRYCEMNTKLPGWRVFRIIGFTIGGIFLAAFFALILGVIVQLLWNWLMPSIFGLREISFLQAVGLLFLSKLLFGGLRNHHVRHPHDQSHRDHWKKYRHFWREKGETAAEEIVEKANVERSAKERE